VSVNGISHNQLDPVPKSRRENIPVIYNGCDIDAFELANGPAEYLVFLGRMVDYKGPLEAIKIARESGRPIVLAGEPLTREDEIYFKQNIRPHIDDKNVIYVGPVNDQQKSELFRKAIALVFPIHWEEPFGYVMIEAMACGIPVLACNRGSVAEVVDFGVTGYYTSTWEELPAFVNKATNLDRTVIHEEARQRFSYQRMVEDYLDIYQSLVQG
jgi:glycosyltransferase involved in cell wall biosynthesis